MLKLTPQIPHTIINKKILTNTNFEYLTQRTISRAEIRDLSPFDQDGGRISLPLSVIVWNWG